MRCLRTILPVALAGVAVGASAQAPAGAPAVAQPSRHHGGHLEMPEDPPAPPGEPAASPRIRAHVVRGPYTSFQVNVDQEGFNIPDDAANEPSIAVDASAPNRMAIGWRQFDSVTSSFREAGYAYTRNGGRIWTFPGDLHENVWRSDPVLTSDADGHFFYYSLMSDFHCSFYVSEDGGQTWGDRIVAFGGDKPWTTVDRTGGIGRGTFYASWNIAASSTDERVFTRTTDRGATFMEPILLEPAPVWGSMAVGPEGELYVAGNSALDFESFVLHRSDNAQDRLLTPTFEAFPADLGGRQQGALDGGPNPSGMLGQVWVDVDRSSGPTRGFVYMLASVVPFDSSDPMDVHFIRSTDRGETWSAPIAVHPDDRGAWQWFGTMSVAPGGRIDVVWIESLDGVDPNIGEVVYTHSTDGGYSWAQPEPITPTFDSFLGWPNNNKLGDYYHMVSDDVGAHLAYAATFNGEQDVYYLRIGERDCNSNGVGDSDDLASGVARDCDSNGIPDSCELAAGTLVDGDGNGIPDGCERRPRRARGRL